MCLNKVISIHGAPRSGTTWLGQLMSLHPKSVFRYQPFFSYAFKGQVTLESESNLVRETIDEIFKSDDPFVTQKESHQLGKSLVSTTSSSPEILVMKSVRYHELIEKLIQCDPRVNIIGIVRNPCATINSWLRTSREFKAEWSPIEQWESASLKNNGSNSEYWGFTQWLMLTKLLLSLEKIYPNRVKVVQYERLVESIEPTLTSLFDWANIKISTDLLDIALKSQETDDVAHDYQVTKNPRVATRWKSELEPEIRSQIRERIEDSPLISTYFDWSF